LLGARTKWRLVTEIFRRTTPPPNDESIAAFVRRKFGDELLDPLVAPFVSGVYAGDPEKLSLRASFPKIHEFETKYGSVLRGAMKSRPAKGTPRPGLCSFREGMETLPRALASGLGNELLTEATVTGARHGKANGNSSFEVDVTRSGRRETFLASALIVAAPVDAAAEILKDVSDKFAAPFTRVQYAPVAVVAAGYRRDQMRHAGNGFGFLVPRSEGLRVLGTVWNSSLFPGRAPENMACFTSFAGGASDPELFSKSDDEIAEIICGEVGRILGITGSPLTYLVNRYTRALPQYNLGHFEIISALGGAASAIPGLFLAGNYLSGPSIGSCIDQANQTAEAVRIYLSSIGVACVGTVAHA
jgi:oxygen-dependent protoporphyrinogen oxidase